MRLSLAGAGALSESDARVAGVLERPSGGPPGPPALPGIPDAARETLRRAWAEGEFTGRRKETITIHLGTGRRDPGPSRLLLVGLGPKDRYGAETARRASAEALRALEGRGVSSVAYDLASFLGDGALEATEAVRAVVDGAGLAGYRFDRYRTGDHKPPIAQATIVAGRAGAALRAAFDEELRLVEVVRWTRDIANLPACEATPERLAREARALARSHRLRVEVFDERALARMHCGGILAVGGGSANPPRMIVLEYPGRGRNPPTVAVVGKGITFDSGGISIKPAAQMSYMKFDKSGAVAVLGILRAVRALGVRPRVIGVLGCAENLPSGSAYRPGDLVRTYSGTTIEVLNTDAEGRVVLADALAYVAKRYRPDALIDLATLTGAQSVALDDATAGLVANDDGIASRLLAASARTGEPIWRMPLTDYHRELVRYAEFGDVRNSIEMPMSGMLTAAAFLETFTLGRPWAHLDIAGPAYTRRATQRFLPAYLGVGAVGFGVRLVARALLDWDRPGSPPPAGR
ncbi:MAG: leucyl aminopeptidase [Thermoplasmata archaeon]